MIILYNKNIKIINKNMLEFFKIKQKVKESDPEFEKQKQDLESKNNRHIIEGLESKYKEKLTENPIKIIPSLGEAREIRDIYKLSTSISGDGEDIGVNFDKGDKYFYTDKNGKINDRVFDNMYKTDEESMQTITTIMTDLINRSGYSDVEKNKMQTNVINHLNSLVKKD